MNPIRVKWRIALQMAALHALIDTIDSSEWLADLQATLRLRFHPMSENLTVS